MHRSCCGISSFVLWDVHIPETGRKTTCGWEIHPNTHTRDVIYEMFQGHCHSRYRADWRRSRAARISRIFWRSKNSFEQKAALTFTVLLQTFVDRSWKHFIFVIWKSWRKLEENLEKIWGKYAEHFSFAVLLFCSGLKLAKRFHWIVIYSWLALPRLFRYVPPSSVLSFWHQNVHDISLHSLSHTLEQLCCKACVSRFWQASLCECQPLSS